MDGFGISFAVYSTLETGFTAEHAWLGHPLRERPQREKFKNQSLRALRSGRLSKDLDRQGFVDIYKESRQWQ